MNDNKQESFNKWLETYSQNYGAALDDDTPAMLRQCWMDAFAAGIEEAAKVLEAGTHTPDDDGVTYSKCHSDTCLYLCEERRRLAQSIRQLSQPKPTEEEG
jgi:hypothetical protein